MAKRPKDIDDILGAYPETEEAPRRSKDHPADIQEILKLYPTEEATPGVSGPIGRATAALEADAAPLRGGKYVEPGTENTDIEPRKPGTIPTAMGRGFAEGFGPVSSANPIGLSEQQAQTLRDAGIYGTNPLQRFNEAIINPLAAGAGLAIRTGAGGMRALQEGLMQAGREGIVNPLLARDIAALPEAFPTMGAFAPRGAPVRPVNPLERLSFPEEQFLSKEFRASPGLTTPQILRSPADASVAGDARSVGAAGTPSSLTNMTRREELVNRAQSEQEKLNEVQPQGQDLNRYVPGVNPTMAEMEQTVKHAREQKSLSTVSPEISDMARTVEANHTEARQQYFKDDVARSKTELDRLEMERSEQADRDARAAFRPGQTTDAGNVAEAIRGILDKPRAKENTQLQTYVKPLLARLYEKDGTTIKSDPEQLYGLREDINRMRSRASLAQDKNLSHVSGELGIISDALDQAISSGAPEYRNYMRNYAEASKRIDELSILQDHENGLNGFKTYAPFQRMMRKIVEMREAEGNNPYKSISDETMQKLWAMRDDLRRSASAQDLARARGSDSVQNAVDIAKNVAKAVVRPALHVGLYHMTNDLAANALLALTDQAAMARLQKRNVNRAHEMLNPNPLKYQPPQP